MTAGWIISTVIAFALVAGVLLAIKAVLRWVTRIVVEEIHKHD